MTRIHRHPEPQIARQVLLGLLMLFAIVVAVEATRSWSFPFGWSWGTWIDHDARGLTLHQNEGRSVFRAELEGELRFSTDETTLEHMAPDAYLEIEENGRSGHRRLEARPGAGGAPELIFWLEGKRREPDIAARAWLASAIPRLLRASGTDVEGRVTRILAKGGAPAVLAEIEQISTDAVQRSYFDQLFDRTTVMGEDLAEALRIAGREIGTDAELAEVLTRIPAAHLDSPELRRLYLRAAETLGTDAELRRTLEPLISDPALDAETLDVLLEVACTLGTDAELAELLTALPRARPQGWSPPPSFFDALDTIGTQTERERVLAVVPSG